MQKLRLSKTPTPIQRLDALSKEYQKPIYIKRDDMTGVECSGNKIRKLEYSLAEAKALGCDSVITMGALQSNHCRATAFACVKEGLSCHLILRGKMQELEGNLFLDLMLGAKLHVIAPEASREAFAQTLMQSLQKEGKKPYLIPVGASNAIGSRGYADCFSEILDFERESGIVFDAVCLAVGSGGSHAGLLFANRQTGSKKRIVGFAVCDDRETFQRDIQKILLDMGDSGIKQEEIEIIDSYIGRGYALASREEIAAYLSIAQKEGIVLDPCYTGKGFIGMLEEIRNGCLREAKNVLFVHTGGLMGWTHAHRQLLRELTEGSLTLYEL